MMAIVGMLAYEFQVTLPVVAKQTFHGGSATYGFLTAAMGVGAVLGGLVTATRGQRGCGTSHGRAASSESPSPWPRSRPCWP